MADGNSADVAETKPVREDGMIPWWIRNRCCIELLYGEGEGPGIIHDFVARLRWRVRWRHDPGTEHIWLVGPRDLGGA